MPSQAQRDKKTLDVHEVMRWHRTLLAAPIGHSTMHLYPIDGAAPRVPPEATAFAHRVGGWAGAIVGVDPDPANAATISQWARDDWKELHPASAGAAYINFTRGEGRRRASYGGNYDRLARIKLRYDPGNFFQVDQNIAPSPLPSPRDSRDSDGSS